jgi:hypothetical protein
VRFGAIGEVLLGLRLLMVVIDKHMNKKIMYAITQDSSEQGDRLGPFYEHKSDAETHVESEKDKRIYLNMWVTEVVLWCRD